MVEQQGLAGRAVVAGWVERLGCRALRAGLLPASGYHRNSGAEVQIDLETTAKAQSVRQRRVIGVCSTVGYTSLTFFFF